MEDIIPAVGGWYLSVCVFVIGGARAVVWDSMGGARRHESGEEVSEGLDWGKSYAYGQPARQSGREYRDVH